jgi:hypothetical protein
MGISKQMLDAAITVMRKKCVVPSRISLEWMQMHFPDVLAAALRAEPCEPVDIEEVKRGIYIASKTKHADRWRFLRDHVGEPIISTWIDEAGQGESGDLADLWRRCIDEASRARILILYREPEEVLKGGWIELGAALASGVTVFAVGIEEFTVAKDARIRHFPDMKAAIEASRALLSKIEGGEDGK